MKPLLLPIIACSVLTLPSCQSLKRGYDSVAKGTGKAWSAVANAGGSVVSGTASLGKKTGRLVTGTLKKEEPTTAAITISLGGKQGVITIALDEQAAPEHVKNFRKLAGKGFYTGLGVHRAVAGHLIQMGDPRSKHESARAVWGLGGPGYTIPAEINLPHRRGSIGMARLGDRLNPTRQSNGSQFYICLKPMPELNGQYTVFGHVIGGIEFADAIAKTSTDDNDSPLEMIRIDGIRMLDANTPAAATVAPATPPAAPQPTGPAKPHKKDKAAPAASPAPAPAQEPAKRRGWFGRMLDVIW